MAKICVACSVTEEITGHHVLPSSLGGTKADGFVPMCRPCHDLVHCDSLAQMLDRERYRVRLLNRRVLAVVLKYRQFIKDATRWYRQGILHEKLGIDDKAPRNARRDRRYTN